MVAGVAGGDGEHSGEAHECGVFVAVGLWTQGRVGMRRGGDVTCARFRRSEVRLDELRSVGSGIEVAAVSGDLVEREEGLAHGKRVAEIRACWICVVVAEAAAGKAAVDDDPLRGTLCFGECGLVAAGRVEIAERGDHPSVLSGVNVLVDARNALRTASG